MLHYYLIFNCLMKRSLVKVVVRKLEKIGFIIPDDDDKLIQKFIFLENNNI